MQKWNDILEAAIIGKVCTALSDDGFRVELSDRDSGAGEIYCYAWKTEKRPAIFSFWVKLIPGNGADVLSDHTTNLEAVLKPVNDFAASWMD